MTTSLSSPTAQATTGKVADLFKDLTTTQLANFSECLSDMRRQATGDLAWLEQAKAWSEEHQAQHKELAHSILAFSGLIALVAKEKLSRVEF